MLILEGGQGLYYVILIDRTVVVTHTIRDTTTIPMTYGYILNDNRNWSPRWPAFSPSLAFLVSNDLIIKIIGDSEKVGHGKDRWLFASDLMSQSPKPRWLFFFRSEFHQRQSSQRAWEKKRLAPNSDEFSWFSPWFNSSVTWFFFHKCFGQAHLFRRIRLLALPVDRCISPMIQPWNSPWNGWVNFYPPGWWEIPGITDLWTVMSIIIIVRVFLNVMRYYKDITIHELDIDINMMMIILVVSAIMVIIVRYFYRYCYILLWLLIWLLSWSSLQLVLLLLLLHQ